MTPNSKERKKELQPPVSY